MSFAWEVTEEDVENVLKKHKLQVSDTTLSELHGSLDCDKIEKAVLYYTDFDDQCNAALKEIEEQLKEQIIKLKG
jgi:hypothetical protein